jgi:hypothetical protein
MHENEENNLNNKDIISQEIFNEYQIFNKEIIQINNNLDPQFFLTTMPYNKYALLIWLMSIFLIIYLLIEYMNKY